MTYKSKSLTLYYTSGTSDKEYQVWVEQDSTGTGYDVYGLNGRRGAARTRQVKATGVALGVAERHFNDLVDAKAKKGYTSAWSGTPFAGVSSSAAVIVPGTRTVVLKPALWNTTAGDADFEEYLENAEFVVQEAVSGIRVLAHVDGQGDVCCVVPGGRIAPMLPPSLCKELAQHLSGFFLDAFYDPASGRFAISDGCRDAPALALARREPFMSRYQRIEAALRSAASAYVELLPLFDDEEKYPAVVAFEQSSRQSVLLRRKQGAYGAQDNADDAYTVVHCF